MRKAIVSLFALGMFAIVAAPVLAGTVDLGRISESQLKASCKKAGGTYSGSNGTSSYDCIGKKGTVTCNPTTKKCTGNCEKCGQANIGGTSGPTIRGVLANASAERPPRAPSGPVKPGLLDQTPGLGTSGPATTGSPSSGTAPSGGAAPAGGPILR
ncbi:MAG: hypothetical protein K2Z80_31805 [Xanthobacteraceae bacterium]|nr:hypothetical protein [Xanthobacteraceae bacterium]